MNITDTSCKHVNTEISKNNNRNVTKSYKPKRCNTI